LSRQILPSHKVLRVLLPTLWAKTGHVTGTVYFIHKLRKFKMAAPRMQSSFSALFTLLYGNLTRALKSPVYVDPLSLTEVQSITRMVSMDPFLSEAHDKLI